MVKKKIITKNIETYLFQGQYERFKHWFDIDLEWVEEIFMTREPEFLRGRFNGILKFKLENHFLHFLFLLGMQKRLDKIVFNF